MYSPADVSDRDATRGGRLCACVLLPHLRQGPTLPLPQALDADQWMFHLDLLVAYAGAID